MKTRMLTTALLAVGMLLFLGGAAPAATISWTMGDIDGVGGQGDVVVGPVAGKREDSGALVETDSHRQQASIFELLVRQAARRRPRPGQVARPGPGRSLAGKETTEQAAQQPALSTVTLR